MHGNVVKSAPSTRPSSGGSRKDFSWRTLLLGSILVFGSVAYCFFLMHASVYLLTDVGKTLDGAGVYQLHAKRRNFPRRTKEVEDSVPLHELVEAQNARAPDAVDSKSDLYVSEMSELPYELRWKDTSETSEGEISSPSRQRILTPKATEKAEAEVGVADEDSVPPHAEVATATVNMDSTRETSELPHRTNVEDDLVEAEVASATVYMDSIRETSEIQHKTNGKDELVDAGVASATVYMDSPRETSELPHKTNGEDNSETSRVETSSLPVGNDPQLDSFLGTSRAGLLKSDADASYCDRSFTGWELFANWQAARTQWCRPRAKEASSEFTCAKLAVPLHGDRYVCDGRNLSVDFTLATGSGGGEEIAAVMGQSASVEEYKYKPGFLKMQCDLLQDKLDPQGLQPAALPWLKSLERATLTQGSVLSRCTEWIEEPVVVVSRVEYANFYHTMTDFVGAWSAAVIAGEDPRKVRILFSDGHPVSPFDGAWTKVFSNGHPVLRKKDLAGKTVCLRRAIFALYGYASPMPINWFRADPCKRSPWLASFAKHVLGRYGLDAPSPTPFARGSGRLVNVTLILREDYVAHPRDKGGGKRRNKISNPEELMAIMPTKADGVAARSVKMAFLGFEEQLALIRSTNVLIGMHGAGMTFIPFLADDAVVIELIPNSGMTKFHFGNLAAWSGKEYKLWKNLIAQNEVKDGATKVNPKQFKELVSWAISRLKRAR